MLVRYRVSVGHSKSAISAGGRELEGEFFTDAGRGAGDEDGFGGEEGGNGHGWIV